jgi:hypothetical protein
MTAQGTFRKVSLKSIKKYKNATSRISSDEAAVTFALL